MRFLGLHNRLLQTLIFAFTGLTFYAYYKTTSSDVQQHPFVRNYNGSTPYESLLGLPHSSSSADVSSTLLSQNMNNIENASSAMLLNFNNTLHNTSQNANLSTDIVILSTPSILFRSPSSINTVLKARISRASTVSSTTIATSTFKIPFNKYVIRKDSMRAVYMAGHFVAIPDKCPELGKYMDLVVIIMSAPMHFEARTAIRQTWGHFGQRRDIRILFMLGVTNSDKFERNLLQEQYLYGDIIRGSFVDSYYNLTLKTISTLEWVSTYCSKAKFILKTDDDMFINVPRLVAFINRHRREKNVIFGKLAKKWKPVRNKSSKYFVSFIQYKQIFYPDFCTGPAYLISNDIIHKLFKAALDENFLKLEDVFITGIVANKIGINRVHANEFLNRKISYSPCNVQRGISIHMVKYSDQFDLWKKLLDGKAKCK